MKNNNAKQNTLCIITLVIFFVISLFVYHKGNDFSMKDKKVTNVQIEYGSDITDYHTYFSSQHVVCEDVMPTNTVGSYEVSCEKEYAPFFYKTLMMSVYDTKSPVVSLYETHVIADIDTYDRSQNIHEAYDPIDGNIKNVLYVNRTDADAIEEIMTTNYNKLHQRKFQFHQHDLVLTSDISMDDTYRNTIIISEDIIDDENHEVNIICLDKNYNATKTSYILSSM